MNEGRISIRYAGALYAMAVEKKCEQAIYEQIVTITDAFLQIPELANALSNPIYTKKQKLDLLIASTNNKATKELISYFEFILDKGREEFMIFMCMSYQEIYRKEKKLVVGEIISAVKLDDKAIQQLKDFVKTKYNQQLEMRTKIDPELIGGFVFEVNNQRIDASIKEELRKIHSSLTA
jgi:F-type H+-transporting ATPase subunit delta